MTYLSKMSGAADLIGVEIDGKPVPLGSWIPQQEDRGGFIGQLASIARADRDGSTPGDWQQLRDIFPAVLRRLREKTEITRDLVSIYYIALHDPARSERLATSQDDTND